MRIKRGMLVRGRVRMGNVGKRRSEEKAEMLVREGVRIKWRCGKRGSEDKAEMLVREGVRIKRRCW